MHICTYQNIFGLNILFIIIIIIIIMTLIKELIRITIYFPKNNFFTKTTPGTESG